MDNIVAIRDYNEELVVLKDAIKTLLYQRGEGKSIPVILGILEIVKVEILQEAAPK
jgi:hypothetical protein